MSAHKKFFMFFLILSLLYFQLLFAQNSSSSQNLTSSFLSAPYQSEYPIKTKSSYHHRFQSSSPEEPLHEECDINFRSKYNRSIATVVPLNCLYGN